MIIVGNGRHILGGEMLSLVEMRILLKFSPSLNREFTKTYTQLGICQNIQSVKKCIVTLPGFFSNLRHETDLPPKDHHKCVCRHLLCNNIATLQIVG